MGTDVFLFIECKRSNEDEWKLDSRHYFLPQERREFLERCPDDPFAPLTGGYLACTDCSELQIV